MSELRSRGYQFEEFGDELPRLRGIVLEGINDPFILKAIFTAGGPGSGKTFVSDQMVKGLGLKVVNSDEPLERYLKMANLPMVMAPEDPELYSKQIVQREKAKDVVKRAQKIWEKGLLGLLIDGTGKDAHKIIAAKNRLKEIGYDTAMIFVNAPLEMALAQNAQRERQVAPEVVKGIWKGVQSNIGTFSNEFGPSNFFLIDRKGGRLEGTAEQLWGQQLRRVGAKWLQKPLENPRGQAIIKQLRSTGGKTRDDLPQNFTTSVSESSLRSRGYLGEAVFSKDVKETALDLKSKIKAPYVTAGTFSLGGPGRESVAVRISLDPKEDWPNGIFENSRCFIFMVHNEGSIELLNSSSRSKKFRKQKFKDIDDTARKINEFIKGEA